MKELLKRSFELWYRKRWLKAICKENDRYNHLCQKTRCQHHILRTIVNQYNEVYDAGLTLEGNKK